LYIDNSSILGENFIIEPWNEQPILTDILQYKVGHINIDNINSTPPKKYTKEQLLFRENEIRRTTYLRQSVLSSLNKQELEFKQQRRIATYKTMSIAASIIGFGVLIWQPNRLSNSDIINKYSINNTIDFDYKKAGGVTSRGNYYLMPNFNIEESMQIQDAIIAFNKGNYSKSAKLLSLITDLKKKLPEMYYYLGLSLSKNNNIDKSIDIFEQLKPLNNTPFYNDMLYNLAICYIEKGNIIKARKTLKLLKNTNGKHSNKCESLLKDMRLF
jgi:tetratricopeptide (TPR) repeat protein